MRRESTLIIGGAGFLGNSLTERLWCSGESVIVADTESRIRNYAEKYQGVEYIPIEWPNCSIDSIVGRARNVIHLAWSSNPASSMLNVEADASVNILGTIRILEKMQGIEKFIFMSSGGTVYGNTDTVKISESSPTNPVSAYGISKLCCEKYVQLYASRGGFSHINLRLGNPYGPYQLEGTPVGVIANFVRKLVNSDPITMYGSGKTVRDYLYIDDFTLSVQMLLASPCASGVYNLGSGSGTSLLDIIEIVKAKLRADIEILSHDERRTDVRSIVLDVSKIQNEINYQPEVSVSQGIGMMIEQYQSITAEISD